MIFHGVVSAPIFLYGATYFAPYITRLANETGAAEVSSGKMISWSTFEGPDFRYLLSTAFSGNILSIVLFVGWLGLFYWLVKSRNKYNETLKAAE